MTKTRRSVAATAFILALLTSFAAGMSGYARADETCVPWGCRVMEFAAFYQNIDTPICQDGYQICYYTADECSNTGGDPVRGGGWGGGDACFYY
jgi:hypothetical protein